MKSFIYSSDPGFCRMYFSSSAATPEQALESLTVETGGACLGPEDLDGDDREWTLAAVADNFDSAEQMTEVDADARISHLSEEWGIAPEHLQYLK